MGSEQHFNIVQLFQLVMIDGYQSTCMEPFHFHSVVHNVTQTIKRGALGQFLLRLLYGGGDTETKTA